MSCSKTIDDPFPYYFKLLAQKKLDDKNRTDIGVRITATELECLKALIDELMQLYSDFDHVIQQRKATAMREDEYEAAVENLFDDLGSPVLGAFERLTDVLFLRDTQD